MSIIIEYNRGKSSRILTLTENQGHILLILKIFS